MPASLRSATSTTASIGSSATICAISRPAMENAAWPTSAGRVGDDAGPRRADHAAVALGLGGGEPRLRRLELRLEIAEVEPRHRAVLDQLALASSSVRFCITSGARLRDLRFARLVGQHRDHVALLHPVAALDAQLGEDAAGAGDHHHLASASVRPERTSLRLCGTSSVSLTATRNSFCAAPSPDRMAAWLSACSCGSR